MSSDGKALREAMWRSRRFVLRRRLQLASLEADSPSTLRARVNVGPDHFVLIRIPLARCRYILDAGVHKAHHNEIVGAMKLSPVFGRLGRAEPVAQPATFVPCTDARMARAAHARSIGDGSL